jgi:putative cell wall-binding protein/Tol biopolymer transport system component
MRTRPLLATVTTTVLLSALAVAGTTPASAATTPAPSTTALVSAALSVPPAAGNGPSGENRTAGATNVDISADGRYVAFSSEATNLTAITTSLKRSHVYLADLNSGSVTLISALGGVEGNSRSDAPSISADGKFVAFASEATNLVPGITAIGNKIYVWERDTGQIELGSAANGTSNVPAASAIEPSLSSDGGLVSFTSSSDNLTGELTAGVNQVFIHDMRSHATKLISVDQSVSPPRPSPSPAALSSISADGSRIAFTSSAQLTGAAGGMGAQVYVRDIPSSITTLASSAPDGAGGNGASEDPCLSPDGQSVVFSTLASNLAPGSGGSRQIVRRAFDTNATSIVSTTVAGVPAAGSHLHPAYSADGRSVVFQSSNSELVPDASTFPAVKYQIYKFDVASGARALVSRPSSGTGAGNADSFRPVVSNNGIVAFSSLATDLTGETVTGDMSQVYVRNTGVASRVDRIGGADRFVVSANVADDSFGAGTGLSRTAFIASGETFPDALSAAAAAGLSSVDAPVLLTAKDALPASIEAELSKFKATRIVIVGGVNAVSAHVEDQLRAIVPGVERISGADRFVVSAAIVHTFFPVGVDVAYVASGENFPDALSGSAVAGHGKNPVLLVTKDGVPEPIKAELSRLKPKKIVVLGGTAALSDSVLTALSPYAVSGSVTRITAPDRFALSATASSMTFAADTTTVYVASGVAFPDALSGSPAATRRGGPVLLVQPNALPAAVAAELDRLRPTRIVVLGGTAAVSDGVLAELKKHVAH